MKYYNIVTSNFPKGDSISNNTITRKYRNNFFKYSNDTMEKKNYLNLKFYRFTFCLYKSHRNILIEIHSNKYYSRILSQQSRNQGRMGNQNGIYQSALIFKGLRESFSNEKRMILLGMIFGMRNELMLCPSLSIFPRSLKHDIWGKWTDYSNTIISIIEKDEREDFNKAERDGYSVNECIRLTKLYIAKWSKTRLQLSESYFLFLRYALALYKKTWSSDRNSPRVRNGENILFKGTLGIPNTETFILPNGKLVMVTDNSINITENKKNIFYSPTVQEELHNLRKSLQVKQEILN
ncbi:Plasmodium exported protein, unknown function [Plasmodium gallinaceum]|uniref:Uncharacterized protein n=1 Tax=Plasmodium gallinaceum TaxID=5849 RepID=A0A1J1GTB2_PLAGA|nr:Plasmodium exported protein, unknown function [Plasmodium gallinaceum]CRG95536.1 Plasmodium exported protein, unknown function [Plasmodium gallinaceum]